MVILNSLKHAFLLARLIILIYYNIIYYINKYISRKAKEQKPLANDPSVPQPWHISEYKESH